MNLVTLGVLPFRLACAFTQTHAETSKLDGWATVIAPCMSLDLETAAHLSPSPDPCNRSLRESHSHTHNSLTFLEFVARTRAAEEVARNMVTEAVGGLCCFVVCCVVGNDQMDVLVFSNG